jgi:DNA-binding NarL/FixJ family response regulator
MTGIRSPKNSSGSSCLIEPTKKKAPRLVLGLGVSGLAAAVEAHFRKLGWDVTRAGTAEEAAQLAHRSRTTAVVLPFQVGAESGLLTCAKLTAARPAARVVLIGPEDPKLARYARFAGAVGYIPDNCGVAAVARAVLGN